jgi:GPH family glycoside/pentoside/hexuronide:cation symporter
VGRGRSSRPPSASSPRGPSGFSQLGLFLWFLVAICLYDALYSTWKLNYQSVFPDRFRSETGRTKAAGIGTLIGVFGIAAAAVVPTFIIKYGEPSTYLANALVFAAAMAVLCLPLAFAGGYWAFVAVMFGWGLAFGGF